MLGGTSAVAYPFLAARTPSAGGWGRVPARGRKPPHHPRMTFDNISQGFATASPGSSRLLQRGGVLGGGVPCGLFRAKVGRWQTASIPGRGIAGARRSFRRYARNPTSFRARIPLRQLLRLAQKQRFHPIPASKQRRSNRPPRQKHRRGKPKERITDDSRCLFRNPVGKGGLPPPR